MEEVYVNGEDLANWSIDALENLKKEVKRALEIKEKKDKVVIWKVVEYNGPHCFFIDFKNALKYVIENYVKNKDFCVNEGVVYQYESRWTCIPRIHPVLILPDQITYYVDNIMDYQKEEKR